MVVQVLTYAWQFVLKRDTRPLQHLGPADAGELEQMGRTEGAGTQYHLTRCPHLMNCPAALVAHTRRPPIFEQDALHESARAYSQVRAPPGRAQIGKGSGAAHAVPYRHVHGAEPLLLRTVIIVGYGITGFLAGADKRPVQGIVHIVAIVDGERSAVSAVYIPAKSPGFRLSEIRQHVPVVPPVCTLALPLVEVASVTSHVNHP